MAKKHEMPQLSESQVTTTEDAGDKKEEVKQVKVISKYPSYQLFLAQKTSRMFEDEAGSFQRVYSREVLLKFRNGFAMTDSENVKRLKESPDYERDYWIASEFKKAVSDDRPKAMSFLRELKRRWDLTKTSFDKIIKTTIEV